MIEQHEISFQTKGCDDILDITPAVAKIVTNSSLSNGIVHVFVSGSTAAISTIEYEPGLLHDLPALFEKLIPKKSHYRHNETWQDGNGFSHLRATWVGPSLTVPFRDRTLALGTWQQIVLLEFDLHPRMRNLIIQLLGE